MPASQPRPTRISILLRLYPRDWRARYADEFAGLLADTALTPAKVLDIAFGALDARWSADYPSAAGDDRKVRRPMVDRLAALLTAAGGIYFAALMAVILVASPPEDGPAYIAALLVVPVAMAALTLGIAGLSLSRSGGDMVGRALGLVASALAGGITLAILYLFLVGDAGWDALMALFAGFAAVTGLVGLRIALSQRDRLPGAVLLVAGAIATVLWLTAMLPGTGPADVTTLNFGIVTVAWGIVGLLRLRPTRVATAMA
jgi:hypothetical protein